MDPADKLWWRDAIAGLDAVAEGAAALPPRPCAAGARPRVWDLPTSATVLAASTAAAASIAAHRASRDRDLREGVRKTSVPSTLLAAGLACVRAIVPPRVGAAAPPSRFLAVPMRAAPPARRDPAISAAGSWPPERGAEAAARALLYGATLVPRMRDPAAALRTVGLPSAWAALTGPECAEALGRAQEESAFSAVKPAMYRRQYGRYVSERFVGVAVLPVLFIPLRAFISSYVVERENKASNLSSVVSALHSGTACVGEWALTEAEYVLLKKDIAWLKKSYPSAPVPVRELTVSERELFYAACERGGPEGLLAMVIVKVSVAAQMRFTETTSLWEQDVVLGEHGVLIEVILDKTHKTSLKPFPRVCCRYPPFFGVHDANPTLQRYLKVYGPGAPRGAGAPRRDRPFLTKLVGEGVNMRASDEELDSAYVKRLLERFFLAAGLRDVAEVLNLHCFRSTGFNDIANRMYLGRRNAAEAGGWAEGGCVLESYQRRTAMDLSCSIYMEFLRVCALLRRENPPTCPLGRPPG